VLTILSAVATNDCGKYAKTVSEASVVSPTAAGSVEDAPAVMFRITSSNDVTLPNVQIYDCVYNARGKTARFRLQLRQDRPASGAIPMAPAEGKFIAVGASENTALIEDLKKALEAKRLPKESGRITELAFDAMVIGERQSRRPAGGYSNKPRGDWKLVKLFLPKGGDDGEVFLNLNPVSGEAEFSIKDPDYGDYLLEQFAKVL
jgi:hypothetical protein